MSHTQKRLMTTGAVMVALSAFVPNPLTVGDAYAQATATMDAQATIVNPLGLSQVAKLISGKFAVGGGAGKIGITTAGAQSNVSNAVLLGAATAQNASLKMTAPKSVTFKLSIPTYKTGNNIKLAVSGKTTGTAAASELLSIVAIKMAAVASGAPAAAKTFSTGNPSVTAVSLTGGTTSTVALGATISFGATQNAGTYTGTYQVVSSF